LHPKIRSICTSEIFYPSSINNFFCSGEISPTSESDYPSLPYSTLILFTNITLNADQSRPSTQDTITKIITFEKLRGASQPGVVYVMMDTTLSIQQYFKKKYIKLNINILTRGLIIQRKYYFFCIFH
jgi:hypothetical protein